jgi:Ca-activated chloride channel family protein
VEDWLKQQQQQNGTNGQQQDSQQQGGSQQQSGDQPDRKNQNSQSDSQKQASAQQHDSKDGQQQHSGKNGQDKQTGDDNKQQPSAQEQARAQQAEREAGDKFRQDMKRQLQQQGTAKSGDKQGEPKPVRLGAREGDTPQDERDQAVEQWLARVPDDPGGLLRRKFRLEYEMRRNGGRVPEDDGE